MKRFSAVAVAMVVLAGCGPDRKAVLAYDEAITAATKKLHAPRKKFSEAFGPALNGGPAAKQHLREALAAWKVALGEVRQEVDALKVPKNPSAAELSTAVKQLLDGQAKMLDDEFQEMCAAVEDDKLSGVERQAKLEELRLRVLKAEEPGLKAMLAAKEKIGKEYNTAAKAKIAKEINQKPGN
jgi:hypothetical protein